MKLDYSILWFDDQPDNLVAAQEGLKTRLAREGFDLKVKWIARVTDPAQLLTQLKNESSYDLILMDWNLGTNQESGAKVAKRVRTVFRYTDIVFYSSAPAAELRGAIFEVGLDGVYCITRGELIQETMGVVHSTIHKVVDLNHMRGIVMAAVADLDHAIDDCIKALYSRMPPDRQTQLVANIVKRIKETAESNFKQAAKLAEKGFEELMQHRSFSTALKQRVLQSEVDYLTDETAAIPLIERLSMYDEEVIKPRNTLGHARAIKVGDKLTFKGSTLVFDKQQMSLLRQNLIAHQTNISDLFQVINSFNAAVVTSAVADAVVTLTEDA